MSETEGYCSERRVIERREGEIENKWVREIDKEEVKTHKY